MSASGRFVAFTSFATNLVAGDTNDERDVFLRDRDTDADGIFDEAGAVSTVRVSQRGGIEGTAPARSRRSPQTGTTWCSHCSRPTCSRPGSRRWPSRWCCAGTALTGDIVLVSRTTAAIRCLRRDPSTPDVSDDGNQIVFVYGGSLQRSAMPASGVSLPSRRRRRGR